MSATLIDGKAISKTIQNEIKAEVAELNQKHGLAPGLAVVLVGENPASQTYVGSKRKTCKRLGFKSFEHDLPADASQQQVLETVQQLNENPEVHGILVQLPLPEQVDENKVLLAIDPAKDVDGFHPVNLGNLVIGKPSFVPCTPYGIQQLIIRSGVETKGAHAVVVGRSNIVGKPVALLLMQKAAGADATVTVCHSRTKDIAAVCREADILIVAIGRAKFLTADMVKPGATVIDVGINRVDGKLCGDVDFDAVKEVAGAITPVPGGVGPMTIAMLMTNTLQAAKATLGG